MAISFPVLMSADRLSPTYRWRLVDGFYRNMRAPVEGCGALSIVAITGMIRHGGSGFAAVLVLSIVILAVRLAQSDHYNRRIRGQPPPGDTPDRWAWFFMFSSLSCAGLWGVLNLCAHDTGSATMQFFVMTVQSGWLGATCTRNAASPATIIWQAVLVLGPAGLAVAYCADHFMAVLIPFGVIQFSATLGIARAVGEQIESALMAEQALEAANAKLTELSATDGLTGIANRRAFDAALTAEWGRAARDGSDLGLLVIDADYFKAYNDTYGHPAGDDCLRLIADAVAGTLRRPPDTAARFGGEEFVALLPGTSLMGAMDVAERVRSAIMAAGLTHRGSAFGCVTVSIGVASIAPHPGTDPQALIDLADHALYEAKHAGRNLVRCGLPALGNWVGAQVVGPSYPGNA